VERRSDPATWAGADGAGLLGQGETVEAFKQRMDAGTAQFAKALLLMLCGACALDLIAVWLNTESALELKPLRMAAAAVLLLVTLIALGLERWRGPRVATLFFCTTCMVELLLVAWTTQTGVSSAGMAGMACLVVMLGFLVGPRAAMGGALLSIAGQCTLWVAEQAGWIRGLGPWNIPPSASYLVISAFA